MYFGFNVDVSGIDLWDDDIPSKHFVCLQDFLKTSSRHIFKTCSTFLSSKTSWRLLGRRKIATLKTCWRCLQDISWRFLQDISWRLLQEVLKTSSRHLEVQKMFSGYYHQEKNVCFTSWVVWPLLLRVLRIPEISSKIIGILGKYPVDKPEWNLGSCTRTLKKLDFKI